MSGGDAAAAAGHHHRPQQQQHARLAWGCFFLLGSGILAPWNAVITAADLYEQLFPGRHMDRIFTIAYLPACLLFLAVTINWPAIPARPRILCSYGLFTLIMCALPLVDVCMVGGRPVAPDSALWVLIAAVVVVGVLDGLSQGAIFGDASVLPPQYTHAVVGGTASSGVIISLLRILTKGALPATRAGLRSSAGIFFTLAGLICLACFLCYGWFMPRLGVVQHYRALLAADDRVDDGDDGDHYDDGNEASTACGVLELSPRSSLVSKAAAAAEELPPGSGGRLAAAEAAASDGRAISQAALLPRRDRHHSSDTQELPAPLHQHHQQPDGHLHLRAASKRRLSWLHVLREAWRAILALFCVYVVTLSLFPGVLAEDVHSDLLGSWYPLLLITLFNVADLTGKLLPFGRLHPTPAQLLGAAVCRVVFVPAFWAAARFAGSWVWLLVLLTVGLGLSNGFLTALIMTLSGPESVEGSEAGLVENMLVFALVAGLTVGAFASWLWLLGGQHHPPP